MDLYTLQKEVKKRLTKDRFFHTLGVQTTSFSLALLYDEDYNKATYAGLLHDLAKCLKDEELLGECRKFNLPISKIEEDNPYLLHGKLGAYYANTQFSIDDKDILNAINYHTTGRPNMSLLEKIVFVADYIEPNRKESYNPCLKKARKLAFENIDRAVFEITKCTLDYLVDNKSSIDTLTIETYNYYSNIISNDINNRLEGNE